MKLENKLIQTKRIIKELWKLRINNQEKIKINNKIYRCDKEILHYLKTLELREKE